MKQFLSFVQKEALHIIRDPRTLFILFGMPIVQIMLFGFALTNEVKNSQIAILNPSPNLYSQQLVEKLDASKYFEITHYIQHPQQIDSLFKAGNTRMVVVISENADVEVTRSNQLAVQLIADASDPNTATILTNYATTILSAGIIPGEALPYQIQIELRMLYNPQQKGAYNFVPGVMAMILLLICTMMTSISIVREKENGTMELLLASPISPVKIILAKTVPYLLLSAVNISTILLLSVFVLSLPIAGSLLLLISLSLLFTITALSLGLLISTITDSQRTAMMISLVGMFLPTLMFSGFMFPIENMPLPLQMISKLVPARWYFTIVKNVMIKGLGFSFVWKETLILLAMTIFLITLSVKKFNTRLA